MAKGTLNQIIIIGALGADPEIRHSTSGNAIASLRIATTERRKVGDAWEDATEWHRATVFGKMADFASQYLTKGAKVMVQGSMRTRKWQDKNGQDRYDYEIAVSDLQLMSRPQERQERQEPAPQRQSKPAKPARHEDDYDDDLPF